MNVYNKTFLTDQALNTNTNSQALELLNMFGYSIQAKITGTPTGELKLQGSDDKFLFANPVQPEQVTTWNDIHGSAVTVTSSGVTTWNATDALYNFVRLVYTDASGSTSTATMTATFNGKGV